ncbi:MAG: hypothetical protein K2J82_07840 [Muribaculaceae bacterium]|nr:hypothetical protein [Muribaculaceae bacterium]
MGYDKGLLSIDPGTADNVKFYTRLYPVGSSRNIDREKYGYSRLQLPGGQKYVEINADKYGRVDHYEADAFADIYPRRTGTVSEVRSEVKTGEDGNEFTIYYFKDSGLNFDPNDYEIGGLVKRVSFQEGSELAGLGEEDNGTYYFEVNFNSSTREFEIITIWPYDNDMQLPGDKLIPKIGDKYILWNLRMPDEYYGLAEAEFLAAVEQYNADHNLDISVYKAPTDHVWIEDNGVVLTIGQRIRLESEEYFPETGYRESRITKITRKVNLPSSMDIEISDALSRTSMQKVSDSISEVRSYAEGLAGSMALPDIIRTGDKTRPTDNNILSARRTYTDLLHKDRADRMPYLLSSDEGFEVGSYFPGMSGGIFGIDKTTGGSYSEIDKMTIRHMLTVMELVINQLSVHQGDTLYSEGDTIDECYPDRSSTETLMDGATAVRWWVNIRPRYDGYITGLQPGMVLMGTVNNLYEASTTQTPASYYTVFMRVNGAELGTSGNRLNVTLYPDNMVPAGKNFAPCSLMALARWGHQTEAAMQRLFRLNSHDGSFVRYEGVDKPIIDIGNIASFIGRCPKGIFSHIPGVKEGDEIAYFKMVLGTFIQVDHLGNPIPEIVDTGEYDPEREYRHACFDSEQRRWVTEKVWYKGCSWLCMVDGLQGITPGYGVIQWAFKEGNPTFTVDFEEKQVCYTEEELQTFGATLTLTATLYNQDVLAFIQAHNVTWSRVSYDSNGALRAASDAAWIPTTDMDNKRLLLSYSDFDYDGTPITKITFTAIVAIDDTAVAQVSIDF